MESRSFNITGTITIDVNMKIEAVSLGEAIVEAKETLINYHRLYNEPNLNIDLHAKKIKPKPNNNTKIIKRTLIALFSAIAIIFAPYLIGVALLTPNLAPVPLLWIVGLMISILFFLLLYCLYTALKLVYQWIISDE